ncbi:hypothetical protein HY622_02305 [Candidatus Uhrbacteria bacterium]|nr:hypothetical protein [Candidatus Uhrbacteria bacterium]
MNKQCIKDGLGWGFLLWLIGYGLGMALFSLVPLWAIGWIITPIATAVTLWVLMKKIHSTSSRYFFSVSIVWTGIAVVCDYFFLVKAFNPPDGYYKLDVYIYYALTFTLPLLVGWYKTKKVMHAKS